MFEKASRMKLRFASVKGSLTVEDLWDVPLTASFKNFSLDDLAKILNKNIKLEEEESFVTERSSKSSILELKFEIVKYIIKVKLNEAKQAKDIAMTNTQIQKIQHVIMQKEDESMSNQSLADLKKKLKQLQKLNK